MKEFDLKSIWESADQDAKQWYTRLRPELIENARKQSNSVLHKIRRLAIMESISGGIGLIGLLYFIRHQGILIIGGTAVLLLALLYFSFYQYKIFKRNVDQVPTLNIVASTKTYLELINAYRKRLFRIAVLLIPFSVALGFLLGLSTSESIGYTRFFEFKTLLMIIPIFIVLSLLTIWITKWYYNYFIGSKAEDLQGILDNLEESSKED